MMLHILNACLFFYFLKRYFNKTLTLFLSLIFLIHPIQVESIAYIGAAQSELLFLFGLSALLVSMQETLHWKQLLLMSFFLLLSLLTKETGFLFLVMSLLYQFLYKRQRLLAFIPYILGTVVLYALLRFVYAGSYLVKNISGPIGTLSLYERLFNIPAICFYYLKTFFYPSQLAMDQRWIITSIDRKQFYYPLFMDVLFFILVGAGGFYVYKKRREYFPQYLFFFVWLSIGLGLIMQLYPLDMTVADRWFYFPLVGLLGLLGIALQTVKIHAKNIKITGYILGALLLLLLSARTIVRNTNWHDPLTLYAHASTIQKSFDLENMLGVEYAKRSDYDEAFKHFVRSSKLFPNTNAIFNRGLVYEHDGNLQKAREYYISALQKRQKEHTFIANPSLLPERLASISLRLDKPQTTKNFIEKELKQYPNSAVLWMYLAMIYYTFHNRNGALITARRANMHLLVVESNYVYNQILHNKPIKPIIPNP